MTIAKADNLPTGMPEGQYRYSVKLETTAKGFVMPSVHVYSDELEEIKEVPIALFVHICDVLNEQGFKVATDIREEPKGQ